MGDATVNNEDILMKRYNLQNRYSKSWSHHGSRTSSSKLFIKDIEPKISLISSGKIISIIYLIWMLFKD